jgi:hypothetical protein
MASTSKHTLRIGAKNEASAVLKRIQGDTKSLSTKLHELTSIASNSMSIMSGLAGAFGSIASAMVKPIELAGIQEMATKRLDAALRSVGDYTPKVSQALQDHASALQRVSRFGDEAIMPVQQLLLQFGGVAVENIPRATKAVLDFAEANDMDLKAAAMAVAKSLGSSTNALTRYGIEFDNSLKGVQRFEAGIGAIEAKLGGFSQELTSTHAGAVDQVNMAYGDLLEKVGEFVTKNETIKALMSELVDTFNGWGVAVRNAQGETNVFDTVLKTMATRTLPAMLDAVSGLGAVYDSLADKVSGFTTTVEVLYNISLFKLVEVADVTADTFTRLASGTDAVKTTTNSFTLGVQALAERLRNLDFSAEAAAVRAAELAEQERKAAHEVARVAAEAAKAAAETGKLADKESAAALQAKSLAAEAAAAATAVAALARAAASAPVPATLAEQRKEVRLVQREIGSYMDALRGLPSLYKSWSASAVSEYKRIKQLPLDEQKGQMEDLRDAIKAAYSTTGLSTFGKHLSHTSQSVEQVEAALEKAAQAKERLTLDTGTGGIDERKDAWSGYHTQVMGDIDERVKAEQDALREYQDSLDQKIRSTVDGFRDIFADFAAGQASLSDGWGSFTDNMKSQMSHALLDPIFAADGVFGNFFAGLISPIAELGGQLAAQLLSFFGLKTTLQAADTAEQAVAGSALQATTVLQTQAATALMMPALSAAATASLIATFGASSAAAAALPALLASGAAQGAAFAAFADGGRVDRPTFALIGEAGAETIIPETRTSRARGLIDDLASRRPELFAGQTGGSTTSNAMHNTINITVNGGDRAGLASNIAERVNAQLGRRIGR